MSRPGPYARMVDYNRTHDHKDRDLLLDDDDETELGDIDERISALEYEKANYEQAIEMCKRGLAHGNDEQLVRLLGFNTQQLLKLNEKRRKLAHAPAEAVAQAVAAE